jgi:hypothetical protein
MHGSDGRQIVLTRNSSISLCERNRTTGLIFQGDVIFIVLSVDVVPTLPVLVTTQSMSRDTHRFSEQQQQQRSNMETAAAILAKEKPRLLIRRDDHFLRRMKWVDAHAKDSFNVIVCEKEACAIVKRGEFYFGYGKKKSTCIQVFEDGDVAHVAYLAEPSMCKPMPDFVFRPRYDVDIQCNGKAACAIWALTQPVNVVQDKKLPAPGNLLVGAFTFCEVCYRPTFIVVLRTVSEGFSEVVFHYARSLSGSSCTHGDDPRCHLPEHLLTRQPKGQTGEKTVVS